MLESKWPLKFDFTERVEERRIKVGRNIKETLGNIIKRWVMRRTMQKRRTNGIGISTEFYMLVAGMQRGQCKSIFPRKFTTFSQSIPHMFPPSTYGFVYVFSSFDSTPLFNSPKPFNSPDFTNIHELALFIPQLVITYILNG